MQNEEKHHKLDLWNVQNALQSCNILQHNNDFFFTWFVKPVEDKTLQRLYKKCWTFKKIHYSPARLKNPFLAGTLRALISFIKRLP